MSTLFDRLQDDYDRQEAPKYWEDDEASDRIAVLVAKAFERGFDRACEYHENPTRFKDVDINDYQSRECDRCVEDLG